tara:strand:- start:63693 stop:64364 length:672 start_codon:yes stop_codon:yes gene_type:complete
MKYTVTINAVKKVDELEGSWTDAHYKALLEKFNYPDAQSLKPKELREFLFMAIADFEPNEAAEILLEYKLADELVDGQIDNLSHEMLREKIAENYSDITLHKELFEVNQLLYKAYNGKFPLTQANVITFELKAENGEAPQISKEIALKALSAGLKDSNLIHRLFEEPLRGKAAFPEAEHILWELQSKGEQKYEAITSEKWIEKEDFTAAEFEATVIPFEDEEE